MHAAVTSVEEKKRIAENNEAGMVTESWKEMMIKGLGIGRIGRHSKLFNFSIQDFILKKMKQEEHQLGKVRLQKG